MSGVLSLDSESQATNSRTPTLNSQLSTLNPQPSTLNPQPSTLNPQLSTLNPQQKKPTLLGAGLFDQVCNSRQTRLLDGPDGLVGVGGKSRPSDVGSISNSSLNFERRGVDKAGQIATRRDRNG